MSCILYLLWPGCMWAAITKALSSGPQGPFTQWCNVCALMALTAAEHSPYQGPRPSLPRPSGRLRLQRTVYSTTANKPCTKERKKASRRGEELKRRMKNRGIWSLGSWLLSIKGPPSLLLWRERGEEGRSAFLSLHALEGCRLWLRNGGMKAGLSPCRHAGIGWIMLSQRDRMGPSLCPRPKFWLTRRSSNIHGYTVQKQSPSWEWKHCGNKIKNVFRENMSCCELRWTHFSCLVSHSASPARGEKERSIFSIFVAAFRDLPLTGMLAWPL